MNKRLPIFFCILFSLFLSTANAQLAETNTVRIAVLAPLYLDSVYNGNASKLQGVNLPKYMLAGVDFYHGIMKAVDSLQKENIPAEVFVYDTKMIGGSAAVTKQLEQQNISLIIASFNSAAEQKIFSDFSFDKNIPLISATYPNDAGITGNPFFVIVNSTIKTHIDQLFYYASANFSNSNFLYATKAGRFEEKLKAQFDQLNQATVKPLKYKAVTLLDNFQPDALLKQLDSTKQNLVFCGTLNNALGLRIVQSISAAKSYKVTVVGPPTWEYDAAFNKDDCKNVDIVYTSPFNYIKPNGTIDGLSDQYKETYAAKADDIYFKGFEAMYHFTKLYAKYPNDFITHISDPSFIISCSYNFQPVHLTSESFVPDYIENKKLYYIKKHDGIVISVY